MIVSMALCIVLWEWLKEPIAVMILSAVVSIVVGYVIVSYILSSLLKTNRFLDILLKDTLHELNIPLSVIKANLQMLQIDERDPKKHKRLERIALASDDLYALYKEVDYYIKKEIHENVKEAFFLDELVGIVIGKQKEMFPHVEVATNNLHMALYADRHGLSKVISNLLHNAIKYNQDNRPIDLTLKGTTLCIKDQGVGMSESELFLAFDRYYQADATKEGYGIGLSLVKAYCDEFGVSLRIASKKGEGTEVFLDISSLVNKNVIIES
jgi:signal transduction histidine kinase